MLKVTISLLAIAAALGGAASPLHAGLEKMTGITLARAMPRDLTLAQAQVNPSPPTTPGSPFDAGLADRRTLESWFASLTGDFKKGAEYWAGQRSSAKPGSCYLQDGTSAGEWTEGCLAAQSQLAPMDARRKAEPEYRQGWNSYTPSMELASTQPNPVASAPAAEPSQAYKEGLADRQDWEEYFNALSDQTKEGAEYWVSHRSLPDARCQPMTVEQQGEWKSGCLSAKLQLDPTDKRRLAESDYRQGWNSYAASASQPTAPSVASTSAQTAAKDADTAPPNPVASAPAEPDVDTAGDGHTALMKCLVANDAAVQQYRQRELDAMKVSRYVADLNSRCMREVEAAAQLQQEKEAEARRAERIREEQALALRTQERSAAEKKARAEKAEADTETERAKANTQNALPSQMTHQDGACQEGSWQTNNEGAEVCIVKERGEAVLFLRDFPGQRLPRRGLEFDGSRINALSQNYVYVQIDNNKPVALPITTDYIVLRASITDEFFKQVQTGHQITLRFRVARNRMRSLCPPADDRAEAQAAQAKYQQEEQKRAQEKAQKIRELDARRDDAKQRGFSPMTLDDFVLDGKKLVADRAGVALTGDL